MTTASFRRGRSGGPAGGPTISAGTPTSSGAAGNGCCPEPAGKRRATRPAAAAAERSSAPGSTGLPGNTRPSSPTTFSAPENTASVAGMTKRRGRDSGPVDAMSVSVATARATGLRFPIGTRWSTGSRDGSPGNQAHPSIRPALHATKPSMRRMAAMSIGLPSKCCPATQAETLAAPAGIAAPSAKSAGFSSILRVTFCLARSLNTPPGLMPAHPGSPASDTTMSASRSTASSTTWRCKAWPSARAASASRF
jgi:hypothetical protein